MTLEGQKLLEFSKIETVQNGTAVKLTAYTRLNQFAASGWFRSNVRVNDFLYNTKAQFRLVCDDVKSKIIVTGDLVDGGSSFNVRNIELTPKVKNMKFNITGLGSDPNVSKFKCFANLTNL